MSICTNVDCTCLSQRLFRCIRTREHEMHLQTIENSWNLVDTAGKTLLDRSLNYDNAEMVQHTIDEERNVNEQDDYGVTPLFLRNLTIVDMLLKSNVDIYLTASVGVSPLRFAARRCIYAKPEEELGRENLQISKSFLETINGDFFANKAVSTETLSNENSPVKVGALVFGNEELTKLENYTPDPYGYTPLRWAMYLAKFHSVKMSIKRGAKVSVKSTIGRIMPLQSYACKLENLDENSELSISSSTVGRKNGTGLARTTAASELRRLFTFAKEKTSLRRQAILAAIFQLDTHCFYLLLTNLNWKAIGVLDELGVEFNVNARDVNGITALISAAFNGHVKHVEFLLDRGADVNLQTNDGQSALEVAILALNSDDSAERRCDTAKIVHLLLHYGATFERNFLYILRRIGDSPPTRVIIAHLALIGAIDKSKLIGIEREDIVTSMEIKGHFDLCVKQLEEMRSVEIQGMRVTLFQLLSESDEKIVAYARNPDLTLGFDGAMQRMAHVESHYLDTIEKRIGRAFDRIKFERKAASIIETLTGLCSDVYYTIVCKIIDCLSLQDITNLHQVDNTLSINE